MKIICILILILLSGCATENQNGNGKIHQRQAERQFVNVEREMCLGEAFTKIIDTGINRVYNIELVCSRVSGMEILPGKEFSFNGATGKKTSENGYKYAPVIVEGEKSYGIGGGVCQVSTTIYQAALNAGMEITEHHTHSHPVAYATEGTDATVVFGVKDFKFINNSDSSVFIYVWVQDEKVYGKIVKKEITHKS